MIYLSWFFLFLYINIWKTNRIEWTYTVLFTSNISPTWQRAINKGNTITQFDAADSSQTRLDACRQRGAATVYMPPLLSLFMPVWVQLHLCAATLSYIQPLISNLRLSISDSLHFCKGTLLAQHDRSLLPRILWKRTWFSFFFPHWENQHLSFFFEDVGLLVCLLYENLIKSFMFQPWFPIQNRLETFLPDIKASN